MNSAHPGLFSYLNFVGCTYLTSLNANTERSPSPCTSGTCILFLVPNELGEGKQRDVTGEARNETPRNGRFLLLDAWSQHRQTTVATAT